MSRLINACLALALIGAVPPALAQADDGVIRITVLTDMEHDLSDATGTGSLVAARMAVAEHGETIAPVAVEAVHNTRSARGAGALARQHLESGTDLFVGLAGDDVAKAVQRVAGDGEAVVMAVGATSRQLTGSYCGRTGFHWSPDLSVMMRLTDPERRRRAGTGTLFVFGDGRLETLRRTHEYGAREWGHNVAGQLFVSDIRRIGLYATTGMSVMVPFYWNRDEASRAFAQAFRDRYGAPPTYMQAGVYSAVGHYLDGVARSGGDEPLTVAQAMREIEPDDVYARDARIRADGQLLQAIHLMRVKDPVDAREAWDYLERVETLEADEVFAPASACRLANGTLASGG